MAELRDFRGRISVLTDVALDAEARAIGRERQEIVRDVLDAWAMQKVHAASLLIEAVKREGLEGLVRGASGIAAGSNGSAGGTRGAAPVIGGEYARERTSLA